MIYPYNTYMDVFIVVSYDSIACCNMPANVRINGIYLDEMEALERQQKMCGGKVYPMYENSKSVTGENGFISWIKKCQIGDLENMDVKSPS